MSREENLVITIEGLMKEENASVSFTAGTLPALHECRNKERLDAQNKLPSWVSVLHRIKEVVRRKVIESQFEFESASKSI